MTTTPQPHDKPNLWGIHCVVCSVDAPCEPCQVQINAEHSYQAAVKATRSPGHGGYRFTRQPHDKPNDPYTQGLNDGVADALRECGGRQLPDNADYRAGYSDGFNRTLGITSGHLDPTTNA